MSETRADRPKPGTTDTWRQLDADVRAQLAADLERLETTPLEFGQHIAWSECLMGRTNGFSEVHQVGFPQIGRAFTTCGQMIPSPIRWLSVSPAMAKTMRRCIYCEAETARIAKANAA